MKEIWKDVIGFEGYYQVSNMGRVKSLTRVSNYCIRKGKILSLKKTNTGYLEGNFSLFGKRTMFRVHREVAKSFLKNDCNYETVNHIDGNKLNNKVTNLEWVSIQKNIEHAFKNGLRSSTGEKNCKSKLTENDVIKIKEFISLGYSDLFISKKYDVSGAAIWSIRNNVTWKHLLPKQG